MDQQPQLAELVAKWAEAAERVLNAQTGRKFRQFNLARRQARKTYLDMKKILRATPAKNIPPEIKNRILATAATWRKTNAEAEAWKMQIQQKIQENKRRKVNQRQLGKYFASKGSRVGNNVLLKAR